MSIEQELRGWRDGRATRSRRRRRVRSRPRAATRRGLRPTRWRSEEHTSELQSLMRISYAVFCLKKKKKKIHNNTAQKHHHTLKMKTSTRMTETCIEEQK